MSRRQNRAVGIPHAHIGRLKRLVRFKPARGEDAGDRGSKAEACDEAYTGIEVRFPEMAQWLPGQRWFCLEEGGEDGVLVEGQADGGGGGAQGEDEAEVGRLGLEGGHFVCFLLLV